MNKYQIEIVEIKPPDLNTKEFFVHLDLIDVENPEDLKEIRGKIEKINLATNKHFSEDVEMVKFTVSCNNKPKLIGKGRVINEDQDIIAYRFIKIEGKIEKIK